MDGTGGRRGGGTAEPAADPAPRLSIGALSRASGVPVDTLRTWERRYGWPTPQRKPSGHRVYPLASVPRLRRIAEALARGHRAAEVVPASDEELRALLGTAAAPAPVAAPADPADLLPAIAAFDAGALAHALQAEWARLGPLDFVRARVAPLVQAVGDAWERGTLDVRHEHFVSERLGGLLRTLRLPLEERARGPLAVLATLSGEQHGLGLQMAALVLAAAGWRTLVLGTDLPAPEIVAVARERAARAVGLSVSRSSAARAAAGVARLRALLPRRVALLVGGDGAPRARTGVLVIQDLGALDAWARETAPA